MKFTTNRVRRFMNFYPEKNFRCLNCDEYMKLDCRSLEQGDWEDYCKVRFVCRNQACECFNDIDIFILDNKQTVHNIFY